MKKILLIIFLLPFVGFGQVTGDYRSSFTTGNTGSWTSLSSWQYYNGSSWVTPTTYPGQNTGTGTVTIRDSHIITINTNITNSFTSLVIGSGTSGELVVNSDITVNTTSVSIMSNGTMSFASNKSITFPANSSFSISSGGRLYASNSNCSNQTALYIGSTKVSACTGNGGGALSNFDSFNSGGGTGRATSNTPVCAGNQLVLTAVSPVATSGSYTYTYRWSGPGIYYNPDFSSSATYTINDVNIYNHGGNYIVEIKRNDGFISSVSTNVVVNPALITPTNLRPENVTPCASTVKWDGSATKFYLDVATNDTFSAGTILPAYNNLDVGNINSVNLTGLSPNTIYYFRVRASGGCGFSPYSKGNFTTLSIDVPRNVRSEHVNWCTSTIMWDGSATKYFLDVATSNTFSAGTILPAYNNLELGNVNSLILSGLSPNTMYHFRLRRLESCGLSGNSTVNSFTTMTIASPVADPGSGSCNNWVAQWHGVYNVSGQEVDGYYLDVAIDNNFTNYVSGYQSLYVDKASNRNYTITGLSPGGVYYYRLRAKTTCGTGTNSNVITFTEKGNNSSTPGTIGGGDSSICVGNTTTFTKDPNSWPSTGTWSIFNQTGSATITQGGVVTGVSPGTVLVVFSTYNGCYTSSSKSLTINGATFTTVPSSPICSNVDATYTTQSGKSNYVWTISGSLGTDYTISAGGTTTNSVTLKWLTGGSKTVSVNYSGGCSGSPATNTVTVNSLPITPGTITQSTNKCASSTGNIFSVGAVSGATSYTWSVTGTGWAVTGGQGTISATITIGSEIGIVSVTATNGCGTSLASTTGNITPNIQSVAPTAITGTITICNGASTTLTVSGGTAGTGATAQWFTTSCGGTPVGTGNSIAVSPTSNTTYYVRYSGTCNTTTCATTTVTVNPLPVPSGTITGTPAVCQGQNGVVYSVSAIANATGYIWNLPSGAIIASGANTNSITVNYSGSAASGNITVKGTNNCGDGAVSANFQITVNNVTTPTATVTAQPNCSKLTGTITLGGLPTSGTIYQTVNSVTTNFPVSQVAGNQTISGLAAGSYTFTVNVPGGCASAASDPVTVNAFTDISTWNGTGWIPGVPGISSKAVFAENYNENEANLDRDEDIEACSCEVRTGAKVIIKKGHTLKVVNEVKVETGAELTFENNASLVQVNEDPNINSGDISYHRHTAAVKRYDYTYWSSPVAGQTMHDLSPNTFYDKYYSYNDKWVVSKYGEAIMKVGEGYIIRAPQDHEINTAKVDITPVFEGVPNNGKIEKLLTGGKLYLLGNPYPSALDANAFLEKNEDELQGTLYFWTHNTPPSDKIEGDKKYNYATSDYATYNRTGGVTTAPATITIGGAISSSGAVLTGKIAAGQGFFAPASTAGGTLEFNNTMRVEGGTNGTNNSQFFKLSTAKTATTTVAKTEKSRIWLNLTNSEGAFKQTLVGYVAGATNEYEGSFDGVSYDGNAYVDFYSVNNEVNLAIQGRALPFVKKDSVALGYKSTIVGDFQISIDQTDGVLTDQSVFLEDKDLKVIHDLKKEAYAFNTQKGTFNNRFVLRYVDKNAVDDVIIPETPGQETNATVIVSVKDGEIKVNASVAKLDKVVVYDMAGRKLFQKNKVDANVFFISRLVWNQQALVVDIVLTDGTKHSRKIMN